MANGLPDLNDLINYEKYKEDLPDYSLFRQSIADVDPVSAVTAKAVPSLQDTFAPSSAASAPAIEAGAGNQFLDLYNSLVNQNPSPVVAPDTSNQQLAEIAATSIAPALIGLILKGKRGAGIGAAIGGQAGAALSQRQRAEAIQQAQLDNQTQRETRQLAQNIMSAQNQENRLISQERIAEANRIADRADRKLDLEDALTRDEARQAGRLQAEELKNERKNQVELSKYQQANKELSELGVEVTPTTTESGVVAPLEKKNIGNIRDKASVYVPTMKLFDELINTMDTRDSAALTKVANRLILQLKSDPINKGGAAFSNLEYTLNSSGLFKQPVNLNSANVTADTLNSLGDWVSGTNAKQALIDTALYYKSRANDELKAYGGQLRDSYISPQGEEVPTIWGRLASLRSTYDNVVQGGTGTQTAASPFQFNMSRAQEAFKRRQGVQ